MKIGIDISPLESGHFLQHRVRGTGYYLTNLKDSLEKYFPENKYIYFKQGEKLDSDLDLIHIPYFEPFFITLPIFNKFKKVVTVHDLTPLVFKDKFPSGIKGKVKWEIQKKSLKKFDAIITDSISSKNDIEKFVKTDPKKVHVIHLAAASNYKLIKNLDKNIFKKYKLPEKFLLYVGDATWNKNLPNLIKAVNKTEYNLVIVGKAFTNDEYDKNNPWNHDLYEAQVLAGSNKNIFPLGFVPDEDLIKIYNCATAFIMPSFYEGFGLPILEAMASSCPVITTKKGSLEEIADSAAYFIDPYDVDNIISGIKDVMEKRDLRKALTEKGIKNSEKFTWKKTAFETMQVYKNIINE